VILEEIARIAARSVALNPRCCPSAARSTTAISFVNTAPKRPTASPSVCALRARFREIAATRVAWCIARLPQARMCSSWAYASLSWQEKRPVPPIPCPLSRLRSRVVTELRRYNCNGTETKYGTVALTLNPLEMPGEGRHTHPTDPKQSLGSRQSASIGWQPTRVQTRPEGMGSLWPASTCLKRLGAIYNASSKTEGALPEARPTQSQHDIADIA